MRAALMSAFIASTVAVPAIDSIRDSTGPRANIPWCSTCVDDAKRYGQLSIDTVQKAKPKRDQPPAKISKLAIAAETDADRYENELTVSCWECQQPQLDYSTGKLKDVVDGIMRANTFATQAEVKAWEQEITPCEHTLCLQQATSCPIQSQQLGRCSACELSENLWLCLACGNLACGRAQFGGGGGNGHALKHTEETHHPVAIKLGSITPEGTADVYCYSCNEERSDPDLAKHLAHWGINIADREKTEKSLTELQVEQNLKWDFSMTTEDGKELKPLFGPRLTGLKNLGNSCYLASVLQTLFSLPEFEQRYHVPDVPQVSSPATDLETQLRKLADGLISGRYSKPDPEQSQGQRGLAPAMLKHLVGQDHEEFSSMRQQDAFEFLLHLFKLITRSDHSSRTDPIDSFRFVMEQRLQCRKCQRVRYRSDEHDNISIPVPARKNPDGTFALVTLKECFDAFTAAEVVEMTCPACGDNQTFDKQSLFQTFPQTLALNARRFELINWVPTKLDIPVLVEDGPLDLSLYRSAGLQDGETVLPEQETSEFVPNAAAMQSLEGMGFPRVRAEKALHATGNENAEAAMEWLFGHLEDPDIDVPLPVGSSDEVSAEGIETLAAMGIAEPQARKALRESNGDVNRALDWVFSHPNDSDASEYKRPAGSTDANPQYRIQSLVCHKGGSIHAGHYVAFVRRPMEGVDAWVLFNDEKVVEAADVDEMGRFAYVYFLRRSAP